jgi:hypothetical protein
MTDHVEINRRNWDERAAIHARDTTGDYMLDRFRAGEDALHEIEATELGDIPESAFCICSAISAGIHFAWYGAVRLLRASIFPVPRSVLHGVCPMRLA